MYNKEKISPFIQEWNRQPWAQKFWPLKAEWEGKFADNAIGRIRKKVFDMLQSFAELDDWECFNGIIANYSRCKFARTGGHSGTVNSLVWLAMDELNLDKMVGGSFYDLKPALKNWIDKKNGKTTITLKEQLGEIQKEKLITYE
jgi:hypothetical protein